MKAKIRVKIHDIDFDEAILKNQKIQNKIIESFRKETAKALNIDANTIQITALTKGSVIIDFEVHELINKLNEVNKGKIDY